MHRKQNGSALLTAIFIAAIAAVVATTLMVTNQLLIRADESIVNTDQRYLILQGMEIAVKNEIKKEIGNPVAQLPTALTPVEIDGMTVRAKIDSEDGKFNLNDLENPKNQLYFVSLLKNTIPNMSTQEDVTIADAITNWITNTKDNTYYAKQDPSYQSSRELFTHISELPLIRGITPAIYETMKPYITALPANTGSSGLTTVDINAVSAPVLSAINPGLTLTHAQNILNCRNHMGMITNLEAFTQECVVPEGISSLSNVNTTSTYFLSHIVGRKKLRSLRLTALFITVPQKNNTLNVNTMWQEFH